MDGTLAFAELLGWVRAETGRWRGWFARQPEAVWAVPVGTGRTATVRDLLFHVYVVDLRYGQRLLGLPVSTYEQEQTATPIAVFDVAAKAHDLLERFLREATPAEWERIHTFETISAGTLTASGRKIVAHTLTHHVRHLAQVATAVRQHGFPSDWGHDLLLSDVMT